MRRRCGFVVGSIVVALGACFSNAGSLGVGFAAEFASDPPARPLPAASSRPLGDGPTFFVDGKTGDDAAAGTKAAP